MNTATLSTKHDLFGPILPSLRDGCRSHPALDSLQKTFQRFSERQLRARLDASDAILRNLGMTEKTTTSHFIREEELLHFDPLPLIIDDAEWRHLQHGLEQRIRAYQALIRDLYSDRKVLKDGILPLSIVLDNVEFYRECVGLPLEKEPPVRWCACDLTQDSNGQWQVVRDHFSNPPLLSHALQNRRTQTQLFPELFESHPVAANGHFAVEWIENLRRLLPDPEKSSIVLLTNSRSGPLDFDHSYLARKLGVMRVFPRDLIVRKGTLRVKTIQGLQRVHLVIRNLPSTHLDPLTFNGTDGVPGLMDCLRTGSVQIVNLPGTGLIGQRAMLRYSDLLIRYYLRELPLLPSIPTFLCSDPDQLEEMREKPNRYEFAWNHNRPSSPEAIQQALSENSPNLVAHPRLKLAQIPTLRPTTGKIETAPFTLRCFALVEARQIRFLDGGLTQVWQGGSFLNAPSFVGKDTWILGGSRKRKISSVIPPSSQSDRFLGSRVAESLYWLGRYQERAEGTARFLSILDEMHRENIDPSLSRWIPLWQALSRISGHRPGYLPRLLKKNHAKAVWYLTYDSENPASILQCLASAKANANELLEYVPPEAWTILTSLHRNLSDHADQQSDGEAPSLFTVREGLDATLNQISAFRGMIQRTMPQDDGRYFLKAGVCLERALLTITAMSEVYNSREMQAAGPQPEDSDLENEVLTVMLRALCTLDAYRRKFQFRALPRPVAEFLLFEPQMPISAAFCLEQLQEAFASPPLNHPEVLRALAPLRSQIKSGNLDDCFPTPVPGVESPLIPVLDKFRAGIEDLHEKISDAFFAHQAGGTQSFFSAEATLDGAEFL